MWKAVALGLALIWGAGAASAAESWPPGSAWLLGQARKQPDFAQAERLHPNFYPTRDGQSFIVVWQPQREAPKKWIVSLPGTGGFATKDLSIWYPHLQGRNVGVVNVQWWLGRGDRTEDYYTPSQIYREIDLILARLGVAPGSALLHGFSRGSANIYAVAALDRTKGHQYFSTIIAHSGSANEGYPPTQEIVRGAYGARPFAGTRWITVCGERDSNPERDGCPAMRRTGTWIKGLGGTIGLAIEDPEYGHGALHLNPINARKALDDFLGR
ncbi:MAG: hypothetical protein IPI58_05090 [Alphaproteobacteria bacterium]|nr:MAG: hypothetical protein IPI58_05090 [Alphaproteobacteria bacterium]